MNPYSISSLMGFLANLCLGVYIFSKDTKSSLNRVFAFFAFSLSFWAFGEFMWRTASDAEQAFLWNNIAGVGYYFFPAFLLHFMFIFSKKEEILQRKIIYLLLYLPPLIFFFLLWNTNLMAQGMIKVYWGYDYVPGKLAWIYYLWATIVFILYFYLCFQLYKKTKIKREKMQAKFAGIALLIPITLGLITDAFLPLVGIQVFRLAIIGTTAMAILIAYAMQRYQLMTPSPEELFRSLTNIMNEPFLIINPEGTIRAINPIFGKLTGYNEEELIGKPLVVIFAEGKRLEELIKEEPIRDYECIFLAKNGEEIPVSFSSSLMRNGEGELIDVIGIVRDMRETKRLIQKERELAVTAAVADVEKKRAEELENAYKELEKTQDASLNIMADLDRQRSELDDAKAYVENIIKSMIDTLIVINPDGSIKNVNQATLDLLGYREKELIGQPAGVLFAEEEEEEEELPFKGTRMKRLIEEGSVRNYDMTYRTKSNEKILVSLSGSVMRDADGNLIGIVGIARDMREIKHLMQKERELADIEKKRASELEKAYTDLEYSRDKLESIYRITKAVSSTLELERLLDLILQLTCKILKADGGSIMLFDENTKELVVKSAAGTAKDVVIGKRFKIGERFAGRSFQKGKPILVHDVEEEEWFKALPKYEVIKSGMSVPIEAIKGKLIGVLNLKRTEREEKFTHDDMELVSQFSRNIALAIDNALAYQFLSETKSYVENIIKSMVDTLIVTDAEGRIKTVNQATLDLLKYKEVEIIGQPAGVLFAAEEEQLFKESGFKKLLKSGFVKDMEVTYLTKDKRKIPVSLSGSVIRGKPRKTSGLLRGKEGKLEGVVCVAHDLRGMKEAQSQLVQAEKLSAIGRLAGSVAHEVRNPLGVILGNIQLLLRKEMDKGIREKLKVVERNVKAAAETTYNLMQFSREEKIEMAPLNLNPLIKKVVSDLKSIALQRDVKVKTLLLKDLPLIDGDKNSLNKLFLNLTLNAIESIREKGEVKILSSKTKDFVKVSITDNGVGIASEDLDKVFEPFWTLKGEISRGVGLGLSVAQRIVETHQGRIEVESEAGKGSKFSVYLPMRG